MATLNQIVAEQTKVISEARASLEAAFKKAADPDRDDCSPRSNGGGIENESGQPGRGQSLVHSPD
jgi:hypothetical protein